MSFLNSNTLTSANNFLWKEIKKLQFQSVQHEKNGSVGASFSALLWATARDSKLNFKCDFFK